MTVPKGGHIVELQPVLTSKLLPNASIMSHPLGEFVQTVMCQTDDRSNLVSISIRDEVHTFVVDIAQPASGHYPEPGTHGLGVNPPRTITCHRLQGNTAVDQALVVDASFIITGPLCYTPVLRVALLHALAVASVCHLKCSGDWSGWLPSESMKPLSCQE